VVQFVHPTNVDGAYDDAIGPLLDAVLNGSKPAQPFIGGAAGTQVFMKPTGGTFDEVL
jgi:hypothetical protein